MYTITEGVSYIIECNGNVQYFIALNYTVQGDLKCTKLLQKTTGWVMTMMNITE